MGWAWGEGGVGVEAFGGVEDDGLGAAGTELPVATQLEDLSTFRRLFHDWSSNLNHGVEALLCCHL